MYFLSIDNVRFRKPVTPGDRIEIHVNKLQARLLKDGTKVPISNMTSAGGVQRQDFALVALDDVGQDAGELPVEPP